MVGAQHPWNRLTSGLSRRWRGLVPGVVTTSLVLLARGLGLLQYPEHLALDHGLRWRPPEPMDPHIVIVGITEQDIQQLRTYPIPDGELAALLQQLQRYDPRVIGLDIVRDLPMEPGHATLTQTWAHMPNVIAIEKALPDVSGFTFTGPANLPEAQVGFVDALLDRDGFLRRSLLGATNAAGVYRFSLTIRLAEAYLAGEGFTLENGRRDPIAMRFGTTELTRFRSHTGGYVGADAGGNQILMNFRSGPRPFRMVSLQQLQAGQVDPQWFRNRIVLVGITALSQKDVVNVAAIAGFNPGLVYGIEVQAHAVSQIINAVLADRPLLTAWPDPGEYLWILVWGLLGLGLGQRRISPAPHLLWMTGIGLGLVGLGYGGLIMGVWLPIVPALLAFGVNGVVLYGFALYDRSLRARIDDRQRVIDRTFNAIHNGPLQTLAGMLRHVQAQDWSLPEVHTHLDHLNQELRQVYDTVRQETLLSGHHFRLGTDSIDLYRPLREVLYDVYSRTLERDLPYFQGLSVKVVKFEPITDTNLSLEQVRDLCRFLEEALCNAGKYAVGATRLTVICMQTAEYNVIQVADNGIDSTLDVPNPPLRGRGTQQAQDLARQLGGTFRRSPNPPKGTLCELTWPIRKPRRWPLDWPWQSRRAD